MKKKKNKKPVGLGARAILHPLSLSYAVCGERSMPMVPFDIYIINFVYVYMCVISVFMNKK